MVDFQNSKIEITVFLFLSFPWINLLHDNYMNHPYSNRHWNQESFYTNYRNIPAHSMTLSAMMEQRLE